MISQNLKYDGVWIDSSKIFGITLPDIHNIQIFEAFQKKHDALFDFQAPPASSTAFVRFHLESSTAAFAEKLVKETGIMLLPSEAFEYGSKHARIGFGRKNFEEVLSVFDAYLSGSNKY